MSDQNQQDSDAPTQGQGYVPPQTPPPAQAEPAGQQQEASIDPTQFLTKDEFEKRAKDIEEAAFKRAQGLYTKGSEKIRQRVADLEATWQAMEAGGQSVPEAVKNRQRSAVIDQVRSEEMGTPEGTPQTQQAPAQEQQSAQRPPYFYKVDYIMQNVPPGTPEFQAMVDFQDWQDEEAMVQFAEQKAAEYRQRTASPQRPSLTAPSLAAGGASATGTLEQQFQREMDALMTRQWPPATRQEKLDLRRKWREKGANI